MPLLHIAAIKLEKREAFYIYIYIFLKTILRLFFRSGEGQIKCVLSTVKFLAVIPSELPGDSIDKPNR